MKLLKKLTAAALAGLFMLSATACHKKNEIAVTVEDVEFTSAYYMCAMIYADMEARQRVDDAKADEAAASETSSSEASSAETDYSKEKIDGVDFSKYVKDETLKALKEIAAYKLLCEKEGLKPDEAELEAIEQSAESNWDNGYSYMFEENGVYKSTFVKYITDLSYATLYFDHLYGKEGTKAISESEVAAKLQEKFVLLQSISVSFSTTDSSTGSTTAMTEDEITALKAKINGYADELKVGKKTFEQVYHEYYGTEESSDNQASTDEAADAADESTEEELKPIYNHVAVYGDTDTDYTNDNYETVKAMANGEVKVIELKENAGLLLVVKREFTEDPYYADALDSTVRHLIKDSELEAELEEFIKTVKTDVSSYAIDRFKVSKIVYPSAY